MEDIFYNTAYRFSNVFLIFFLIFFSSVKTISYTSSRPSLSENTKDYPFSILGLTLSKLAN